LSQDEKKYFTGIYVAVIGSYSTLHNTNSDNQHGENQLASESPDAGFNQDYHVFSLVWSPEFEHIPEA